MNESFRRVVRFDSTRTSWCKSPINATHSYAFAKSTVQHMYLLSAIFTKIGDGFDEIQWGGSLEKSLAVIERRFEV